MIKNFTPRLYQETILETSSRKNTLVVLPTGMGKSMIFVMLSALRLKLYPNSKVMVLAPTKPLCEQHVKTFRSFLEIDENSISLFTGDVSPEKRKELFEKSRVISSTPQGLENDLISGRICFEDVSLLVFDECHRAVKDYSYTWLAQHYMKHAKFPRILGLTASPGSEADKINEICANLSIEAIEIRTENDPDVRPYIQEVKTEFVVVELDDDFRKVGGYLRALIKDREKKMVALGFAKANLSSMGRKDLLDMQAGLQADIAQGGKSFDVLRAISILAEVIKAYHAVELLETQGIGALNSYFGRLVEDSKNTKVKAVRNLVADTNFRSAHILVSRMFDEGIEHPKFAKLVELIKNVKAGEKVIVFNHYRDNAVRVVEALNKVEGVKAEFFVGQTKKAGTGLSQKKQIEMLERFRNNVFNVVVMTSVGEEGLDIPKVDLVIFFEPVPSAIRHIQRRGRTGRLEKGRVIILVAKGTRDEAYRWSSFHKEKRMYSNLRDLKKKIVLGPQRSIGEYDKKNSSAKDSAVELKVFADHREKSSKVIKELVERGVKVELKQLEVADYVLSDNVGVEFKSVHDFVDSILDGRLLEQVKDLKYNFLRPLLIIEGGEDIYSVRNVHPNAVRGMLVAIAVSFGVPVLATKNFRETAEMLIAIARREQDDKEKYFSPHAQKRGVSLKDRQEYFISALPNIGLKLARELLEKFGTPKNVVNASEEELMKVEKIGEIKAKKIKEVVDG
jgi:Fanconi anemia group M protein